MTSVVVRDGRSHPGIDASSAWALVADLNRLDEWLGAKLVGSMTTEVPGVGHVFFVGMTGRSSPDRSVRLRVAEWEAGSRYLCEIAELSVLREGKLEVVVAGAPHADTTIRLTLSGEAPGWAAPLLRKEVGRRFRSAHRRIDSLLA